MKKSFYLPVMCFLAFVFHLSASNGYPLNFNAGHPGVATSDPEAIIRKNIADFSANLMKGNYQAVVAAYTDDAKIFPPSLDILSGSEAISRYWTPSENAKSRIVYHKVTPSEITITGNTAYDWGYYEGTSENDKGERSNWRGKYVIVWKEVSPGDWKIYLDCWNRVLD